VGRVSCGRGVGGLLDIREGLDKVPVKGSSRRVVRPLPRSFRLGWCGVHEPKGESTLSCAS
jgi:hypothetical protein